MRMPLLWLNLVLATILGLIYYQPSLFIPEKPSDFVVIAAGPRDSSSYKDAKEGADAFERDWGRRVTVLEGAPDPRTLAHALKYAMSLKPQGISMPGHDEAALLMPFVTEAERRGIRVTFHTTPLAPAVDRFQERGAGYVGLNSESDGERYAFRTLRRFTPKDTAPCTLIVGDRASALPGSRLYGCKKGAEAYGGPVEYLPFMAAELGTPAAGSALVDRLSKEPKPHVIFWDAGPVTPLLSALEKLKYDVSTTAVATFSPSTGLPIGQQLFVKSQLSERWHIATYLSLVQLQLSEQYQVPGMTIPLAASV